MPHPCPHHCPSGSGGHGLLAAVAVVVAAAFLAAIAKPAEHAAVDVLHVVIVCLEIAAALTVVTGATIATVLVRRHVRAERLAALPAGVTIRVRSTTPAAAIAPRVHVITDAEPSRATVRRIPR